MGGNTQLICMHEGYIIISEKELTLFARRDARFPWGAA